VATKFFFFFFFFFGGGGGGLGVGFYFGFEVGDGSKIDSGMTCGVEIRNSMNLFRFFIVLPTQKML
jgi:hypothetical protein